MNDDVVVSNVNKNRRGLITEFSKKSRKRFEKELNMFSSTMDENQSKDYAVTLTSMFFEAKDGYKVLKRWIDWVQRKFICCGLYCLEFQDNGQVHYHLNLRIFAQHDFDECRKEILGCWLRYNPLVSGSANDFKPIWDTEGWSHYLLKVDSPKSVQKLMRGAIDSKRLGSRWWGSFAKGLYHGKYEDLPLAI